MVSVSPPSDSRSPEYLDSLQVFRGLAALWVLLHHLQCIAEIRLGQDLPNAFLFAGRTGVSFFFVLSGFIITHVHWRHLGNPENVRPYAARRLSRIYPVVFIVVGAKLAAMLIAGPGMSDVPVSSDTVIASFLLLPGQGYLIAVLWTLAFEVIFYLVFALAVAGGRTFAVAGAGAWAGLILWAQQAGWDPGPTIAGHLISPACLEFLMGALCARLFAARSVHGILKWLAIPGFGMLAAGALMVPGASSPQLNRMETALWWGGAYSMIILSATSLECSSVRRWPRSLLVLGDASYSVYLVHSTLQVAMLLALKRLGFDFGQWVVPSLIGAGILSLAGSLIFWRYVERPVAAWWGRKVLPGLSGRRKLTEVPGPGDAMPVRPAAYPE